MHSNVDIHCWGPRSPTSSFKNVGRKKIRIEKVPVKGVKGFYKSILWFLFFLCRGSHVLRKTELDTCRI